MKVYGSAGPAVVARAGIDVPLTAGRPAHWPALEPRVTRSPIPAPRPAHEIEAERILQAPRVERPALPKEIVRKPSSTARRPLEGDLAVQCVQLYRDGLSIREVAKRLETSHGKVSLTLQVNGVTPLTVAEKSAQEAVALRERLREPLTRLWLEGVIGRDIADQLGISRKSVIKMAQEFGLPRRGVQYGGRK